MTTDGLTLPHVGERAPDFELLDDEGRPQRLSEQRGRWVVLYFYPKDDTPGCTVEARCFRDANDDILQRNAQVWGVSILDSQSKADFKSKHKLPFTLLADEDHAVAEKYGVWTQKTNYGRTYWGVQRATFLIDPEGVVRHVWPTVKPEDHAAEVLATIDAQGSK
jgi:thioredoxin-dependent peroxiredoxin